MGSVFLSPYVFYMVALILIYSSLLLFNARHNMLKFLSVLLILYSNFSFCVLRYFDPNILIVNEGITEEWIDLAAVRCVSLFTTALYILTTYGFKKTFISKQSSLFNELVPKRHNSSLVVISIIALVIIWFFFYDYSPDLTEGRAGYSPIYEYSIVFFILGFWYAGDHKRSKMALMAIAAFYIVFDFLGGQRSTGMQIGIVVLFMVFYKSITLRRLIIIAVVGVFVTRIVAIFRGEYATSGINLSRILGDGAYAVLTSDTAGMAYYTSLTYIGTTQFFSVAERLNQFGDFVISQLVVGRYGTPLNKLARQYYLHYNGGVLPIYMYYYLGYLGTLLMSILVAKYYSVMDKIISKKHSALAVIIAVYVSTTTVRWYLYSPSQLLRGVMLLTIVYLFYSAVDGRQPYYSTNGHNL